MRFIFVEGANDRQFVTKFLSACYHEQVRLDWVIRRYSEESDSTRRRWIRQCREFPYVFLRDVDGHSDRRADTVTRWEVDSERIALADPHIEAWYVAVLNVDAVAQQLNWTDAKRFAATRLQQQTRVDKVLFRNTFAADIRPPSSYADFLDIILDKADWDRGFAADPCLAQFRTLMDRVREEPVPF